MGGCRHTYKQMSVIYRFVTFCGLDQMIRKYKNGDGLHGNYCASIKYFLAVTINRIRHHTKYTSGFKLRFKNYTETIQREDSYENWLWMFCGWSGGGRIFRLLCCVCVYFLCVRLLLPTDGVSTLSSWWGLSAPETLRAMPAVA
jgi:hypothetical protein